MSAPSANDMYHAAQRIARTGQPVFPCKIYGEKAKAPFIARGLNAASCDMAQIKQWWSTHRGAAIGIPTGLVWDVLDVDIKDAQDGRRHLHRLNELGLLNGCQRVARTPSGGYHLYFRASAGLTNKGHSARIGLDVRAKGGYVLAPPSYIETPDYAGPYLDMGETVGSNDEPLWWDLIVNDIRPVNDETKEPIRLLPSERRSSLAALREFVISLHRGERNNGFHWAVSRCVENGIDPHELVEVAMETGLAEDEVLATCGSAMRRAGVTIQQLDSEAEALFPDSV